jgi:hypothetical protein
MKNRVADIEVLAASMARQLAARVIVERAE